jgi:hypothetical protein
MTQLQPFKTPKFATQNIARFTSRKTSAISMAYKKSTPNFDFVTLFGKKGIQLQPLCGVGFSSAPSVTEIEKTL